jgi:hypothetical protein
MKFRTKYINAADAQLYVGHYHDGSLALVLKEAGEVLCKATVCMSASDAIPERGHVFVKDWGENEGVLAALQDAGVIGPSLHTVASGYVEAHHCKLLLDPDTLAQL